MLLEIAVLLCATAFGGEIAFFFLPVLLYLGLLAAFCRDAN
jgi:hypothetical protein